MITTIPCKGKRVPDLEGSAAPAISRSVSSGWLSLRSDSVPGLSTSIQVLGESTHDSEPSISESTSGAPQGLEQTLDNHVELPVEPPDHCFVDYRAAADAAAGAGGGVAAASHR